MTKNQQNDTVGDNKSPALKPQAAALRQGADQAMTMQASPSPAIKVKTPSAGLAAGARQNAAAPPQQSCQQRIWLSFFFDGTGNNLDADVGTNKHSNVAKLYRAHKPNDEVNGIYRIYIPGVGTYFSEVGDDGATKLGLGTGRMGDVRLDWALKQFDAKMAPHLARANSPGNSIVEINIALFGFSRGAALARAFSNMLLDDRCVRHAKKGWCVKTGMHHLRIRFMGLFDTVASVGLPMSTNTVSKVAALIGVKQMINARLYDADYEESLPQRLAFATGGAPGADPAPGVYDGHQSWGGKMAIPHMVEEVRHFIAAHEVRNSFPVDSVSVLANGRVDKPAQFYETVFPGVHSDVGGSYRPGEGARSPDPEEKLGLIPLHSMYYFAIDREVPLLPQTAWQEFTKSDFAIGKLVLERYNYYKAKIGAGNNLGPIVNAHMALYYAWRFRYIHRKQQGNRDEATQIARTNQEYQGEAAKLDREIKPLEESNEAATRKFELAQQRQLNYLQYAYHDPERKEAPKYREEVKTAQINQRKAQDALLRAKAKRDALPDMSQLQSMLDLYDAQLIADAKIIRKAYTERGMFNQAPDSVRSDLRPHYKVMMDAYENEFIHNKGLKDEIIIAFFDNYVHDSLAGFAQDATLPSDPRAIYLGGDEKYQYALLNKGNAADGERYASADATSGEEMAGREEKPDVLQA
jgi:hypothetical protein